MLCAYAPHSGHPFQERQAFFHNFAPFYTKLSSHGPKLLFSDMNARILKNMDSEEDLVGSKLRRNDGATIRDDSNCHLLIELCRGLGLALANTRFNLEPENLARSCNLGAKPMDDSSCNTVRQIDFALARHRWLQMVDEVCYDRQVANPIAPLLVDSSFDFVYT